MINEIDDHLEIYMHFNIVEKLSVDFFVTNVKLKLPQLKPSIIRKTEVVHQF